MILGAVVDPCSVALGALVDSCSVILGALVDSCSVASGAAVGSCPVILGALGNSCSVASGAVVDSCSVAGPLQSQLAKQTAAWETTQLGLLLESQPRTLSRATPWGAAAALPA